MSEQSRKQASGPPTERLEPPTERLEPPTERLEPPTERLEPPTARRPPPVIWAERGGPSPGRRRGGPRGGAAAGRAGPGRAGPGRAGRVLAVGGLCALVILAIVIVVSNSGGAANRSVKRAARGSTTAHGGKRRASQPTATTARPAAKTTASAQSTTAYRGAAFSAQVPAGWAPVESDVAKGSFTESKWENGSLASTLLVDYQPTSGLAPGDQAAPVRATVRTEPGYSELGWSRGDLAGRRSWKWVFSLPHEGEAVDYFFSQCGTDYAVLGTGPPGAFNALAGRFKAFAASVKHC